MKKLGWVFILNMGCAYAAGGGGSVWDLKWSFVNLVILVGFIAWKSKKPLSEMFHKNSVDVEYLYNIAQERDKESKIKYEMCKKKMEGVDKECDAVLEKFRKHEVDFASKHEKEGDLFIEKLRQEKDKRVAVEKKKMLKEVENNFMVDIILKTKKQIEEDQALKKKITKGLFAKIG